MTVSGTSLLERTSFNVLLTINLMSLVGSFVGRLYVVESERCFMQSFFRCDSFITTSLLPSSLQVMIVSSFDRLKFCQNCSQAFATRDIWLDRELALLYQVLHASPSRVLGWLFL